jgi:hypothetical protein
VVGKEELVDCFSLKENSASDTKEKVGINWPEYEPSHLGVLVTVAKSIPDVTLRLDEMYVDTDGCTKSIPILDKLIMIQSIVFISILFLFSFFR